MMCSEIYCFYARFATVRCFISSKQLPEWAGDASINGASLRMASQAMPLSLSASTFSVIACDFGQIRYYALCCCRYVECRDY